MPKVIPQYREEARERIVEAALKVFSSKGYHGTTMESIASKMGISKGALYLYFPSKEELFKEICRMGQERFKATLYETFAHGDIFTNARIFFEKMLEEEPNYGDSGFLFETLALASRDQAIKDILSETYNNSTNVLKEFLDGLKRKGVIKQQVNTKLLARGLVAVYDGFVAALVLRPQRSNLLKAWDEMMKAIMIGILTRKKKVIVTRLQS